MLAYYSGVLEPAFTSKFLHVTVPRGTAGWVDSDEAMDFINGRLAAHPYIAGETFTVADVLYAGAFALFMKSPLLSEKKTAQLEQYVARCVSRPAYVRAQAKDEPAAAEGKKNKTGSATARNWPIGNWPLGDIAADSADNRVRKVCERLQ